MTRSLAPYVAVPESRLLLGGEPLVFHCNYYNYFLQKTLLLDESLAMHAVIRDAAQIAARGMLDAAAVATGASTPEAKAKLASDTFSELGFGLIDLAGVVRGDDEVRFPVSHYGLCLKIAAGAEFGRPQTWFDAGYAAAAVGFVRGLAPGALEGDIIACQALGAPQGIVKTKPRSADLAWTSPGIGGRCAVPPPRPNSATTVDEAAVLAALATLDFSGNEEGLIPRFGVMLTRHFANFYNRISFEFVHRMQGTGLLETAEELLVEAGLRCAFHTFGGIMTSGEWDAVVRPQCKTDIDLAHGMVAVVNALGWGTWRITEVAPKKIVMRIYDDYESTGWLGMFGKGSRPVSYLAQGGVQGLMELVFNGHIQEKPTLDAAFYDRMVESEDRFTTRTTMSFAGGDPYTEIVAER